MGWIPEYVVTRFAAALAGNGRQQRDQDRHSHAMVVPPGEMLRHAVVSGLMATGCRVLDLGIASTPTCGVMVTALKAAGGLQLTASHNPIEWNGLKPFMAKGSVFDQQAVRNDCCWAIDQWHARRIDTGRTWGQRRKRSPTRTAKSSASCCSNLSTSNGRDSSSKSSRSMSSNCNHGSGSILESRSLMRDLSCEVIVMGGTPDGQFEHPAEPLKENLATLMDAVKRHRADVGFAQDPDADRLAIVDNTGRYIGEELTLGLAVDHVLSRHRGPVVVNGSTSRVTADLAAKYGCQFHRSHVGEANVVSKMIEVNALLGGEGNGGVIEPQVGYVRDSFVSMAYVLDGLVARRTNLADWVDTLPRYTIVKDKLHCPRERVDRACAALRAAFGGAVATEGDGLRLDWPDRWVQVRASNTEPIIRVIAEAPDDSKAKSLCAEAVELARKSVE